MLLALLYSREGHLAAAALACEQQPFGNLYWEEVYPQEVELGPGSQTAYVEIADEVLRERLLAMRFADGHQAAQAVDDYLFNRADLRHDGPHRTQGKRAGRLRRLIN